MSRLVIKREKKDAEYLLKHLIEIYPVETYPLVKKKKR